MSFILDALRKSDAHRQQSAAPGLNSPEPPRPPRRRRRRRWPLAVLTVILVASAAAVVVMRPEWLPAGWMGEPETRQTAQDERPPAERSGEAQPAASGDDAAAIRRRLAEQHGTESGNDRRRMPPQPPAERPAGESADAEKAQPTEPESAGRRRIPVPASPNRVVRRQPERQRESEPVKASDATAELERRMAEEAARRRQAEAASSAPTTDQRPARSAGAGEREESAAATQPAVQAGARGGVPEYVRAWELPLSVRRNLPELDLSIHVFSPTAAERFVLINGERYTAGDSIGEAQIVDIRREGAIVDFRSHRFLLEPR